MCVLKRHNEPMRICHECDVLKLMLFLPTADILARSRDWGVGGLAGSGVIAPGKR